ncbi:hypothetical protein MRX96_004645 [Rhipicephalus microplus]
MMTGWNAERRPEKVIEQHGAGARVRTADFQVSCRRAARGVCPLLRTPGTLIEMGSRKSSEEGIGRRPAKGVPEMRLAYYSALWPIPVSGSDSR